MLLNRYYDSLFNGDTIALLNSVTDIESIHNSTRSYRCESTNDSLKISIDLPGVNPKDISLSTQGKYAIINYELRGKKYTQKYAISEKYSLDDISAKSEHGVLELSVPLQSKNLEKKISIRY